jgi:hypothetical protein
MRDKTSRVIILKIKKKNKLHVCLKGENGMNRGKSPVNLKIVKGEKRSNNRNQERK